MINFSQNAASSKKKTAHCESSDAIKNASASTGAIIFRKHHPPGTAIMLALAGVTYQAQIIFLYFYKFCPNILNGFEWNFEIFSNEPDIWPNRIKLVADPAIFIYFQMEEQKAATAFTLTLTVIVQKTLSRR